MTKFAILFSNFGPYHLARIHAFHLSCLSRGWEFVAIELARSEADYAWQVNLDKQSFPTVSILTEPLESVTTLVLLKHLYSTLSDINPDIIAIAGYSRLAMLAALYWCQSHNKSAILLSATTESDADRLSWKERVKSWLIKNYRAALVGGGPQKRYLEKLGMSSQSIFLGYNVVNNLAFSPGQKQSQTSPSKKSYFLAVNRFIPKKNLPFLIHAYADYVQIAPPESLWELVLCGDGVLRPTLEEEIFKLGLQDRIHLTPFLQQDELLPYYANAGCFIHASTHEQWGLVVNEAMAAGLPVLVSNRCGCFEDLVIEGITGFGFSPYQRKELTQLMLRVSAGEVDLAMMSQAALKHIEKYSPERFASSLMDAADYVLQNN